MDLEALKTRVESHLRSATSRSASVASVSILSGGACQENFRVAAVLDDVATVLALRSDAKTSLPGAIDRVQEFAVIQAAVAAGVKTPRARFLGKDLVRQGASAYFLDWVSGEALGRKVVSAPELAAARAGLGNELANELAKLHRITPEDAPNIHGSAAARSDAFDPAKRQLAGMRASIDGLHAPRPAMELIHRWLRENAPPPDAPVLVHGDFRTGNLMVGNDGLVGILDWEFARWGSPYEDLAWVSLRDWRFGRLDLPIGGVSKRAPFYEAYERASGMRVDLARIFYWEVALNLGWAIGSAYQAERYVYGGEDEFELVAIGRRAAEMEFEAIRLLEKGSV